MDMLPKEPTEEQLRIAKAHRIPKRLAHTVNVEKARAYWKWMQTAGSLERFLDKQEENRGCL